MITYLSGNIDLPQDANTLGEEALEGLLSKRENLGFIDVETHVDTQEIKDFVTRVEGNFENVVVFGMGGSALGLKAILEAAYGKYYNEQKNKTGKNIYVLDNIDTHTIRDVEACIDIKKTLFCFISKSGTTAEPLSQYLYFREKLQVVDQDWKKHFCFVVGENCSMRSKLEAEFPVFLIPENIGGRFSVFTSVGLLPVAFSGVDIDDYLLGVTQSREDFLSEDLERNIPLRLALIQADLYKNQDVDSSVLFSYSSRLFQFGEWYKQLLAESIGKDRDGITPISSIGASDQHSELQLYQDGPANKLFTFLTVQDTGESPIFETEKNLDFQKLLGIYQYGTEASLRGEGHPVTHLKLPDLSEKTIGALLYMYMFQVAYLGELLGINAFDQPGVEKSKNFARDKMKEDYGEVDLFQKAFYE